MKRRIVCFFCVFAVLWTVSCVNSVDDMADIQGTEEIDGSGNADSETNISATEQPAEEDLYKVMVNLENKSIDNIDSENYEYFDMSVSKYSNDKASKNKQLDIFDETIELTYKDSSLSSFPSDRIDNYLSGDGNMEVSFSTQDSSLRAIIADDESSPLLKSTKVLSSEAEFRLWVEPVAEKIFKVDLSECTYYAYTFTDEPKVLDGFALEEDIASNVLAYGMNYRKTVNGMATGDLVKILVTSKGDIVSLIKAESGIDDTDSFTVDKDKIKNSVGTTISKLYENSKTKINSYEIQETVLKKYEDKIVVVCRVVLSCSNDRGDDYNDMIKLAVDISSDNITK